MKPPAPQASSRVLSPAMSRLVAGVTGSDRALAVFIFAFALLVRLAHYDQLLQEDFIKYPSHAANFIAGEGEATRPFTCSPLYLYFWVVVGQALGGSLEAVRFLQIIMGAGSCALIALLGRGLFSPAAGVVAGTVAALYLPFLAHDSSFVSEPLVVFLNLLSLWGFHRARVGNAWGLAGGALCLGLSAAARPNGLLLLPFFLAWGLKIGESPTQPLGRRALAFAALSLLALIPPGLVTLRNSRMAGDLVPVMSDGGIVAYIGNNGMNSGFMYAWPRYEDLYFRRPGEVDPTHRIAHEIAEKETGRKLSVTEASSFWTRQALDFAREHPARYVAMVGRKIAFNWTGYEAHDVAGCFDREDVLRGRPYLLRFTLVGALGLVGAAWFLGRLRALLPLYALLGAYTLTAALFTVVARYRLPMIPALILLGAAFVVEAARLVRAGQGRRLVVPLLLGAALLAGMGWRTYPMRALDAQYRVERETLAPAEAALKAGKIEKARGLLEQTINGPEAGFMTTCRAHGLLAVMEELAGNDAQARTHRLVGRGWAYDPADPEILLPPRALAQDPLGEAWNRAAGLLREGKTRQAGAEFRRLTRWSVNLAALWYCRGLCLVREGRVREGLYELSLARMKDPSCLPVHRAILANLPPESPDLVSEYRELARRHPTQPGFRYGLALALERAGKTAESRREMATARAAMPGFQELAPPEIAPR